MSPLFIPIILGIAVFTMVIFLRKYENDERMAMIDKGLDPNVPKPEKSSGVLRFALLAIGVGFGILIGYLIVETTDLDEQVTVATTIIFGGLGLLLAYFLEQKQNKE
ncbi:DUF6249 domain-containing protein [Peijinzhouia sedimentorum]